MSDYMDEVNAELEQLGAVYRAAVVVLQRWSHGRLDEAVRDLQRAVDSVDVCPECGKSRREDDRVKAGMKCGFCAYGLPG